MNIFDELKTEMLKKYPKPKGFWLRFRLFFIPENGSWSVTKDLPNGHYRQNMTLKSLGGKDYFFAMGKAVVISRLIL